MNASIASPTTEPLVSFCIPTYNRGRYLRSLLEMLVGQLSGFAHSHEVVVSDNASTDDTPQVLAEFADRLPLRHGRHEANLGGSANWQYVMAQARGRYVVYVADDDAILCDRVAEIVATMEVRPQIGIAYAPWLLYDLVADRPVGQFYRQDADVHLARGDHRGLLDALLRHAAFPEIYICRRELLMQVMPRIPEQAFYAFVHAAEYLQRSDMWLVEKPFYVSVTRYFADEQRSQTGNDEAEYAWDRYRGGLEHILGRFAGSLDAQERLSFAARIQEVVAQRIAVAVRLRTFAGRDAVETYYLAYRLKAMGREALLHLPMDTLRGRAALEFVLSDGELNRGMKQLLVVGDFDESVREYIRGRARLPVTFATQPPVEEGMRNLHDTLILFRDSELPSGGASSPGRLGAGNVRMVSEAQLLAKFVA